MIDVYQVGPELFGKCFEKKGFFDFNRNEGPFFRANAFYHGLFLSICESNKFKILLFGIPCTMLVTGCLKIGINNQKLLGAFCFEICT